MARLPTDHLSRSLATVYDFLDNAPTIINESEAVTTGATSKAADTTVYQTVLTTGATAGAEALTIANGTIPGQRKLLTLETLGGVGDSVAVAFANVVNAAGTQATGVVLDAAGEYLLLEWTGAKWKVIYGTATVTP